MFVSVQLCPELTTQQLTSASGGYVPFFTQSGIGFSYPAVSYLISLEVCFSS